MQVGMGNGQAGHVDVLVAEQQQVQVQHPGAPAVGTVRAADTAGGALDPEHGFQQHHRPQGGPQQDRGVDEVGLLEHAPGRGAVAARDPGHAGARQPAKRLHGTADPGDAVALVAAQADHRLDGRGHGSWS